MSKADTLRRAERDIESGDLARARDRIHSLIRVFPSDTALRLKLAEVYLAMGDLTMAGKYSYLRHDPQDEATKRAIARFEACHGRRAAHLLSALTIRCDLSELDDHARQKIDALIERSRQEEGPAYQPMRTVGRRGDSDDHRETPVWMRYGCMFLFTVGVVMAMIGMVTFLRSVFGD